MSLPLKIWSAGALLAFVGCTHSADSNPCELAADRVAECTGERPSAPEECGPEARDVAHSVLATDCAGLMASKADGFFCSAWTRWLGLCDEGDGVRGDIEENRARVLEMMEWVGEGTYVDGTMPDGEDCYATIEVAANPYGYEFSVYLYGLGNAFGKAHFFGLSDRDSDALESWASDEDRLEATVRHRSWAEWDYASPSQFRSMTSLVMERLDGTHVRVTVDDDESSEFSCALDLTGDIREQRCRYVTDGDAVWAASADDDVYPDCGRDEYCRVGAGVCEEGEGVCTPRPVHCPFPEPDAPLEVCGCTEGAFQGACQAHQAGTDFAICGYAG